MNCFAGYLRAMWIWYSMPRGSVTVRVRYLTATNKHMLTERYWEYVSGSGSNSNNHLYYIYIYIYTYCIIIIIALQSWCVAGRGRGNTGCKGYVNRVIGDLDHEKCGPVDDEARRIKQWPRTRRESLRVGASTLKTWSTAPFQIKKKKHGPMAQSTGRQESTMAIWMLNIL